MTGQPQWRVAEPMGDSPCKYVRRPTTDAATQLYRAELERRGVRVVVVRAVKKNLVARRMSNHPNKAKSGPKLLSHCKRGHALVEGNLYWSLGLSRTPVRTCRTCQRNRVHMKHAEKMARKSTTHREQN